MPFLLAANEIMTDRGVFPSPGGAGNHHPRGPAGKGRPDPGRYFWPPYAVRPGSRDTSTAGWRANCFGDYYTRTGLDLKQRGNDYLLLPGRSGRLRAPADRPCQGKPDLGNDKDFLKKVVSQCLPYIGYPRSLNAFPALTKRRNKNAFPNTSQRLFFKWRLACWRYSSNCKGNPLFARSGGLYNSYKMVAS